MTHMRRPISAQQRKGKVVVTWQVQARGRQAGQMKRIALIADTHEIYLALDATVVDLQQQFVDLVVCLGDMVPWESVVA
jgi:hypothetical protein